MITAPYNFVPLNKKVFFPHWSEQVSHDIPFSDGESGEIEITITAKSPIFVRNHSDDKDNPSTEFCNHHGAYYIPGSSFKGMVRSVLEIMSFGKISFFNDDTYAVRDMSDSKNFYMSKMKPKNTFCGWLKKIDGKYIVEDCGIPGRIRQDKIDTKFALNFSSYNFDEKNEYNKTAKYKYEMLEDKELSKKFTHKKNDNGKEIYIVGNDKQGTIVLTGQSSGRKEGENASGKIYEFIFFESQKKYPLKEEVFENFKFAYFDGRKTQPRESIDWGFWKKELEDGKEIPIFFQKEADEIVHFGLSYLYKLPYKYSIKNAIESVSKEHFDKRLDLAQTIFGFIDSDEKSALKGRVQFSHFKVDSKPKPFKMITTVLGSPRASFYPIYMKQECQSDTIKNDIYKTLMEEETKIAGRKRYPLQQKTPNPPEHKKDEDSSTSFQPRGTYNEESKEFEEFTFSGKLRYHNLKRVELGAILSALTFHGNGGEFYHNIGMAKSYGFGRISIDVSLDVDKQIEVLQAYEKLMNDKIIGSCWLEKPQLKELFSMAHKDINIDEHLKYLKLDPTKKVDEFRDKKNKKECLPLVSSLYELDSNKPKSLFESSVIDNFKEREIARQEEIKKIKEGLENLKKIPERMSDEFKKAIENYVNSMIKLPYYNYTDQLRKVIEKREDEIDQDDIYNAYIELTNYKSFKPIEELLLKREQNKATELELAELYSLLTKSRK